MSPDPVDDRTLRNFAWVMLVGAVLAGVALLRRGAPIAHALALPGAGLGMVLVSRFRPRSLTGLYRLWMAFGEALGRVTTPVLLTVVFVAVLVPTRALLWLTRNDPLTRRFDRAATTYWSERARSGFRREDFERLW